MKKNIKKRIVTVMMTFAMLLTMVPATTLTASAVTTARVGASSYCTVNISNTLLNKKGTQYATVKLKTYDMTGWFNTGAKVRVTLKDEKGRYICSWTAKGGDTLKLGDDHRTYRIYVDYYSNPGGNFITQGNNFINTGSSYKWKISNAKNCSIY